MNFGEKLKLLRYEKGLTQDDIGYIFNVTKSCISCYEKGIRECGLDFVIHIADYYGVSCDYLLGRTPDRSGATLRVEDLPDSVAVSDDADGNASSVVTLNKKLLNNSITILYELLAQTGSKGLTGEISSYLMVSVYKMIRTVYSANQKNPQAMFSVIPQMYLGLSSALQSVIETNAKQIASGKEADGYKGIDTGSAPSLSPEVISNKYPDLAPSLYNLIQKTEEKIKKLS